MMGGCWGNWPPTLRGEGKPRDTKNPTVGVQSLPSPSQQRTKPRLTPAPAATSRTQPNSEPSNLTSLLDQRASQGLDFKATHGLEHSPLPWHLGSEPPRTGFQRPKPQRGCRRQRGCLIPQTSSGMFLRMCTWLPVEDRRQQTRAGQTA